MELQGERLIPAPIERTWAALNDPASLKACIAGCESLEPTEDGGYLAVVAVKVGPVSARFKGRLQLSDVQPPHRYTLHFDGQGGVAGFGKGSADVELAEADGGATRLQYHARAQVGGKLAQVGSRLIDAAAGKIAEDFFRAFEAHLTEAPVAATEAIAPGDPPDVPPVAPTAVPTAAPTAALPDPPHPPSQLESVLSAAAASVSPPALPAEETGEPDTNRSLLWIVAVCVILVAGYLLAR